MKEEQRQAKELMQAMVRNDISKLKIKKGDFELELERINNVLQVPYTAPTEAIATAKALPSSDKKLSTKEESKDDSFEGQSVSSPMVGTFYTAPSPESPAFINIGDKVDEDSVVCIVEAMKVMNEIKAGCKGCVKEIHVKNGEAVEFGSKLFTIT